jgi:hypothetical protein
MSLNMRLYSIFLKHQFVALHLLISLSFSGPPWRIGVQGWGLEIKLGVGVRDERCRSSVWPRQPVGVRVGVGVGVGVGVRVKVRGKSLISMPAQRLPVVCYVQYGII